MQVFKVIILFVLTIFVLQLPLAGLYSVTWYTKKNLELDLRIPMDYTRPLKYCRRGSNNNTIILWWKMKYPSCFLWCYHNAVFILPFYVLWPTVKQLYVIVSMAEIFSNFFPCSNLMELILTGRILILPLFNNSVELLIWDILIWLVLFSPSTLFVAL